ncbi:MAG: tripartite tricarboxylate transporter TctB family protein [Geminicoccaceae bacterium]|nr:tripartite tricarboxylate transporter TctB family protein [Geminicoccaceae bacterium]MDW8124103.1 tripartite tricarboxylate transporter TctB family protein [Geminicoccaceae bacterium]MDW8340234.1 tripartite tricarboxylate transporter TctB family protein [Geminicoccaceae bacterium]
MRARDGFGWGERLPALVLFLVALAYGFAAARIEYAFSSDPLGPRVFPLGLAILLALLALAWFLRPGGAEPWPRGGLLVQTAGLVALAYLAAWLFDRAGFLIAMGVLCTGVALMFRATLRQALASGIAQAVLWWLVFAYGLRIPLPAGRWFTGS